MDTVFSTDSSAAQKLGSCAMSLLFSKLLARIVPASESVHLLPETLLQLSCECREILYREGHQLLPICQACSGRYEHCCSSLPYSQVVYSSYTRPQPTETMS